MQWKIAKSGKKWSSFAPPTSRTNGTSIFNATKGSKAKVQNEAEASELFPSEVLYFDIVKYAKIYAKNYSESRKNYN